MHLLLLHSTHSDRLSFPIFPLPVFLCPPLTRVAHLSCPLGSRRRFLPHFFPIPRPHLLGLCCSRPLPLPPRHFYPLFMSFLIPSMSGSEPPPLCHLSSSMSPCCLPSVQSPWRTSPHPRSRCSMPPAGQAWVPWASPSSCWPTTLRWRSQRLTSITMRWTLSPTSARGESTGNRTWLHLHLVFLVCLVWDDPH